MKFEDSEIPKGEAVSNQGTLDEAILISQGPTAPGDNKISAIGLLRSQEYVGGLRGRGGGKSYYSRRRI